MYSMNQMFGFCESFWFVFCAGHAGCPLTITVTKHMRATHTVANILVMMIEEQLFTSFPSIIISQNKNDINFKSSHGMTFSVFFLYPVDVVYR